MQTVVKKNNNSDTFVRIAASRISVYYKLKKLLSAVPQLASNPWHFTHSAISDKWLGTNISAMANTFYIKAKLNAANLNWTRFIVSILPTAESQLEEPLMPLSECTWWFRNQNIRFFKALPYWTIYILLVRCDHSRFFQVKFASDTQ